MIYRLFARHLPRPAAMALTSLVYVAAILAVLYCMPVVSPHFRYLGH